MLANANEEHGHVCGVDDGDERANHVADRVTLGHDEAVETAASAKGRVEVAGLGYGVGADKGL